MEAEASKKRKQSVRQLLPGVAMVEQSTPSTSHSLEGKRLGCHCRCLGCFKRLTPPKTTSGSLRRTVRLLLALTNGAKIRRKWPSVPDDTAARRTSSTKLELQVQHDDLVVDQGSDRLRHDLKTVKGGNKKLEMQEGGCEDDSAVLLWQGVEAGPNDCLITLLAKGELPCHLLPPQLIAHDKFVELQFAEKWSAAAVSPCDLRLRLFSILRYNFCHLISDVRVIAQT
ncbi:hypothetical protein GW17_00014743 [Ensete ventricosum]|nr:hypothetical protein GW17_00014743 [Ensete ventricosum]